MMSEKKDNKVVKKDQKDTKKDVKKNGKPRFNLMKKIREMVAELKKVTWPTRKDLIRHSTVVIVFVVLVTAIVALYDLALTSLMKLVI